MIRAHISYLKYVLRHKWFVFRECQRLGITWRGIVHDLSKFSRAEWEPYVCTFYNPDGSKRDVRDATGHYNPTTLGKAFDRAWLHHIQHNPPKVTGKDDVTGEDLVQRDDDQETTIRKRLEIYHAQTSQLVGFYQKLAASGSPEAPKYTCIEGVGAVETISAKVTASLS